MAIAATLSTAFSSHACSDSKLRSGHNAWASNSRTPSRCILVRASQQQKGGDLLEGTKKNITREDVLKHQQTDMVERQIPGSIPGTPESVWNIPRPEVQRRPETGARHFASLMAFDGPGPETINGRLAMVGIVWAFFAEKATGQTVAQLLYRPGNNGLFYFLAVTQLFTFASLVTMYNGESPDSRANGPFTARAERWNGRLAMLGFLILVLTESYIMGPVFN